MSAGLRPYLLASLLDSEAGRPALVVAGDDRAARDLAADLKAYLAPRQVRFYPARGVRYESHLAPPPHLVGLRIAALDALSDPGEPAVLVTSAVALAEKVPDPALRPHGFTIERASCSTWTRPPTGWWRAATSASTRSRSAASSRSAATSSTSIPPPRSERCAASSSTSRSSG